MNQIKWEDLQNKCPWHDRSNYHGMPDICIAISYANGLPRKCTKETCAPYFFVERLIGTN